MSVDRIGSSVPPTVQRISTPTARSSAEKFHLGALHAPSAQARASSLDAYRKGDLTRDQYVEAKVARAMDHIQGLPAKQRAFIADALRARLTSGDLAHMLEGLGA